MFFSISSLSIAIPSYPAVQAAEAPYARAAAFEARRSAAGAGTARHL